MAVDEYVPAAWPERDGAALQLFIHGCGLVEWADGPPDGCDGCRGANPVPRNAWRPLFFIEGDESPDWRRVE